MKCLRLMCASGLAIGLLGLAGPSLAGEESSVDHRLQAAAQVFKDMAAPPERSIPESLLTRARCIVVIPNVKQGGLIVGARYGAGFMSCREGASGRWSAPGGVVLQGGSLGLQVGGGTSDVVMLAMDGRAKDSLLTGRSKIGTTMSAEAGPVGRAPAKTHADLLTWTHSNGAFAGLTIKGSSVTQDDDANRALYGRNIFNIEVVSGRVRAPRAAAPLMEALREYAARSAAATRARR